MSVLTLDQEEALRLSKGLSATPGNVTRVAARLGQELTQWAFTQWALRERGLAKFARAEEMLFDREGLEMASHEDVAAKANAWGFPSEPVADLTCGIGGDLIALTQGRPAIGFELDPERAAYARHNLDVFARTAEVRVEDCLAAKWDVENAFVDPARRSGGRRTLDPAQFTPRLDLLVERMGQLRFARIKLSPMLGDEFLDSLSPDRVFVSHLGECKEVLVHLGHSRPENPQFRGVWAFDVTHGDWWPGETPLVETQPEPMEYILEADPATVRAHALGAYELPGLGDSNGYLTSGSLRKGAKCFRVHWHGAYRGKEILSALAGTGLRIEVVKCRGVKLDVDKVRKGLKSNGKTPAVLIVYPVGDKLRCAVCSTS